MLKDIEEIKSETQIAINRLINRLTLKAYAFYEKDLKKATRIQIATTFNELLNLILNKNKNKEIDYVNLKEYDYWDKKFSYIDLITTNMSPTNKEIIEKLELSNYAQQTLILNILKSNLSEQQNNIIKNIINLNQTNIHRVESYIVAKLEEQKENVIESKGEKNA